MASSTLLNAVTTTGAGTALDLTAAAGDYNICEFTVSGTFVGRIVWEANDGGDYAPIVPTNLSTGQYAGYTTAPGIYRFDTTGLLAIRPNVVSYTAGAITVTGINIIASNPLGGGSDAITVADGADEALGASTQTKATDATTTSWTVIQLLKGMFYALLNAVPVTGTFWQSTQPISAVSLPLPAGAATATGIASVNTNLNSIETTLGTPLQAGGTVSNTNLPPGASASLQTPLVVGANVGASANNQTLAGTSGKTTYISGFYVTGLGATTATNIKITVTGLLGTATLTFDYAVPLGATVAGTPLLVNFDQPLPASGANTAIVVNVPSFGTGNTSASAGAWGFQQ